MTAKKRRRTKTAKTKRERAAPLETPTCFESLASVLTVADLARLSTASRHFNEKPWPCLEIPSHRKCKIAVSTEHVTPLLERLVERLRRPTGVRIAAQAIGSADTDKLVAWTEEDSHRAAWFITALLSSTAWADVESRVYIARLVGSAVASRIRSSFSSRHVPMSSACIMRELVSRRASSFEIMDSIWDALRESGAGDVLERLVKDGPASAQKVALEAIEAACEMGFDPLGLVQNDTIPAVVSIAQSGCDANKLAALGAIHMLAHYPEKFLDTGLLVVVDLLAHENDAMKDAASGALWSIIHGGEIYVRKACELGCIPDLLSQLRKSDIWPQNPLFCLELLIDQPASRAVALQHGILPLMFRILAEERDFTFVEIVLAVLQTFVSHVPEALSNETLFRKRQILRRIADVARLPSDPNRMAARQLLERLAHGSPGLARLIAQLPQLN